MEFIASVGFIHKEVETIHSLFLSLRTYSTSLLNNPLIR